MGKYNLILMIISLSMIGLGVMLCFVNLIREIQLIKRKNISYANYEQYRKFFSFQPKMPLIITNGVYLFLCIVTLFLLLGRDSISCYMLPILFIIIVVGLSLYLYISSTKYNKNLNDFDNYYKSIKTNYVNKDVINSNIAKIANCKNTVYKNIDSLNQECLTLFPEHSKITNAELSIEPLNTIEKEQRNLLNSFEEKTNKLFDKSLYDYLRNYGMTNSNAFIYSDQYTIDVDAVLGQSQAYLKELFKSYIINTYLNRTNTIRDFERMLVCLNKLSDFEPYNNIITETFKCNEALVTNLDKLNKIKSEIIQEANILLNSYVKVFKNVDTTNITDNLLNDINTYIKKIENLRSQFDVEMINLSLQLFSDYLNKKSANKSNYKLFDYVDSNNYDALKTNTLNRLKHDLKDSIIQNFVKGMHNSPESLIDICELLFSFDSFEPDYGLLLVDYIAKDPIDYKCVIDYMFSKKIISLPILEKCNQNGYEWIYVQSVSPFLSYNQLSQLVVKFIEGNTFKIVNKYLLLCDKTDVEYLKNAISIASVKNNTSILIENYISLLQLDGGFNMPSTRYENIALVLRGYYRNIDSSELDDIEDIIENEEILENKDLLDQLYSKELLNIEPILTKTFKSLLCYSLYCSKNYTLLNENKIKELYTEYKKNLNVNGLLCLCSLLDALMLINVQEKDALKNIMDNLNIDDGIIYYDDFYPLSANKNKNFKIYGKELLRNLLEEHFEVLTSVINHIEKDRLFIDTIRHA